MSLKRTLESLFASVEGVVTALLYPICLLRNRLGWDAGVPILMYHQVGRAPEGARFCEDCVSPGRFEQQVRAILEAGYRVIPLADLVRESGREARHPAGRRVALTFDDGYRDQHARAYPVLKRHGLPATFFLVAGSVGGRSPLPHLVLREAGASQAAPAPGWMPLGWEEAKEMAMNGMQVGSHSLSHRSLGTMPLDEVEAEACASRDLLRRRLGTEVELFAYPFGSESYGDFDARIEAILRRAGYRAACTTVIGRNGPAADPMALRRIPVEERDGPFRIRCKLAGAYDWVGKVKNLWQRLIPREDRVDLPPLAQAGGDWSGPS